MNGHIKTQEGDEMVCSCGLRWEVGEDDPHPVTKPSTSRQQQLARSLHKLNNVRATHKLNRGGFGK